MEGIHHGQIPPHEEQAATLREAGSIVKNSNSELADKLEKMAEHHEEMKSM